HDLRLSRKPGLLGALRGGEHRAAGGGGAARATRSVPPGGRQTTDRARRLGGRGDPRAVLPLYRRPELLRAPEGARSEAPRRLGGGALPGARLGAGPHPRGHRDAVSLNAETTRIAPSLACPRSRCRRRSWTSAAIAARYSGRPQSP